MTYIAEALQAALNLVNTDSITEHRRYQNMLQHRLAVLRRIYDRPASA